MMRFLELMAINWCSGILTMVLSIIGVCLYPLIRTRNFNSSLEILNEVSKNSEPIGSGFWYEIAIKLFVWEFYYMRNAPFIFKELHEVTLEKIRSQ